MKNGNWEMVEFSNNDQYHKLVRTALNHVNEAVMFTNNKNQIIYVNEKFSEITGYTFADVKGRTPKELQSGIQNQQFYMKMKEEVIRRGEWQGEIWNRTKQGEIYLQALRIVTLKNTKNEIDYFIGFFSNISSLEEVEHDGLRESTYYDPLTNLPNRVLFEKRLYSTIQLEQGTEEKIGIVLFQLNDFAKINERYGLLFGNVLLKRIATRVKKVLPANSMMTRWHGMKFACIFEGLPDEEYLEYIISKIADMLTSPIIVNGIEISLTTQFGISIVGRDGMSMSILLAKANKALLQAKKSDKLFCFYEESMGTANKFIVVETELKTAIQEKQFILYYQPLISIEERQLIGLEALIRWDHPTKGIISPDKFIPLAEKTGLINEIGAFVFEETCKQQMRWKKAGYHTTNLSVNLSMNQFKDTFLVDFIAETMEKTGVNPEEISIELTESSLIENIEETISKLKQLSLLGIEIAVDDFGTGYSSLGYLIDFPINFIKIDRSFIKVLGENKKIEAIVTAINSMAKAMDIKVVAEGIETEKQYELVRELRCDIVQGYLFDKPLPVHEVEKKWLRRK